MSDLLLGFGQQYVAKSPVPLAFGYTAEAGTGDDTIGVIDALLSYPPLPFTAFLYGGQQFEAQIIADVTPAVPEIQVAITATHPLDLPDADGARLPAHWRHGTKSAGALGADWQDMLRAPTRGWNPHQHGIRLPVSYRIPHADTLRTHDGGVCRFAHGIALGRGWRLPQKETERSRQHRRLPQQEAIHIRAGTGCSHAEAIRRRRSLRLMEQEASTHAKRLQAAHHQGLMTPTCRWAPWTQMIWPAPGRWWPYYEAPGLFDWLDCDPGYAPRPLHCDVLLHWRPIAQPRCVGVDPEPPPPPGPVLVPIQRVYVVLNDVQLVRAADGIEVPCESLALALEAGSWAWGFSARLPARAQDRVEPDPDPVELLAWINGTALRILVESIARERVFGDTRIRVSGRGHQAVLDAPYAPIQTFSNTGLRTSQQLMDEVLTVNGVPLGWGIDWDLEAWNVPAGVFSHQGTYLSALVQIARAGGGVLIPHASLPGFNVRHRYPVAPWDWGAVTPDLALPAAAVARESLTWSEKPVYNRVFVSGLSQGILGQVTRAGTAGDLVAPMVVDALITAPAAARQRGLAVLGDTGRQIEVGLRLTVFPETQIVNPGTFIEYEYEYEYEYEDEGLTRVGLVRSTQIDVGLPEVWQTLGVETRA